MTSYVGSSLIAVWTTSSGTTSLDTDYRSINYTPNIDLIDSTAGADTGKQYTASYKDGKVAFSGLQQAGSLAIGTQLVEGQIGTLVVSPEGTAAGKQKLTIPAMSLGVNWSYKYNDLTTLDVNWQQNGARTDGTN